MGSLGSILTQAHTRLDPLGTINEAAIASKSESEPNGVGRPALREPTLESFFGAFWHSDWVSAF